MKTVIMPKLDLAMDSGTLVEWFKKEGENVKEGERIASIMTQKVTYEINSPASGVLYKILAPINAEVPVGEPIAIILEPGDNAEEADGLIKKLTEKKAIPEPELKGFEEAKEVLKEEVEKPARIKMSPVAKRLAEEYGINIERIKGKGPEGRITKEDVLRAMEELKAKKGKVPLSGVRKIIAERMSLSHQTIPPITLSMEVDVTEMIKLTEDIEKKEGTRLSYNAVIVKAVAKALRDYPIFNSTLEADDIKLLDDINVGLAVATDYGLVVPVIHNADKKDIKELNSVIEDLVERARQNKLTLSDVKNSTFIVTNLGMFGVDILTPIIFPGQVAILGVGRIAVKPVVIAGQIVVRSMMTLCLTADHRVIDGALAATFLGKIAEYLRNPNPCFKLSAYADSRIGNNLWKTGGSLT